MQAAVHTQGRRPCCFKVGTGGSMCGACVLIHRLRKSCKFYILVSKEPLMRLC